jgi:hypothetical protein
VLHRVGELLGLCRALVDIDDEEIAAALHKLWSSAAPATFNGTVAWGDHGFGQGGLMRRRSVRVPVLRSDAPMDVKPLTVAVRRVGT